MNDYDCPKCEGLGWVDLSEDIKGTCDKCHGDGIFDWIHEMVGKRRSTLFIESKKVTSKDRRLKGEWIFEYFDHIKIKGL